MKKYLAIVLAVIMICGMAACGTKEETTETTAPTQVQAEILKKDYVMSADALPETVVDGVMTEILGTDPILKKTTASWLDTCVLYEVNVRQYTKEGTFKAFEGHLQRLKDMGVNTLWFMPIHPISETERKGTLGSYYAVDDYMAVNPEFGTLEDFQHLVDTAHDMGFKVILDWVANHTGWDNKWIEEHPDWYVHDENGEITYPYDWSDIAELNFDNFEMRAEMIKCMQYWVEEVGIDGFRCDHVMGVPASFWNAAVYKLKSVNSEIMMLAEVSAAESFTEYAFDTCYGDSLYSQSLMVKGGNDAESLQRVLPLNEGLYAQGSFPMNYTDNHDKNSYEGSIVDRYRESYEAMFALSYLAPGMPLIYTSNEQGYDHEIEFFERDTISWESAPKYAEFIKELSALKTGNKALASTNRDITFLKTESLKVLAFSRELDGDKVYFVTSLFFEAVSDAGIEFDTDKAQCVMHYDGKNFDFADKEFNLAELNTKEFAPYEFYVFTAN